MKRVISLWLPKLSADRMARRHKDWLAKTAALIGFHQGGPRIVAVNEHARSAGIRAGQRLADARTLVPDLTTAHAEPESDLKLLETLAGWCERYTPWVAIDPLGGALVDSGFEMDAAAELVDRMATASFGGDGGLMLDVTGCGHLFGPGIEGERALLADLTARLARHGFTVRAAMADTAGAAWALARFAERQKDLLAPVAGHRTLLSALPVEALRLDATTAETLRRLGLRRIGDLLPMPRAPLAQRFGDLLVRRLDQALGSAAETIQPRLPAPAFRTRLAFAEPIGRAEDIAAATSRLLAALCGQFEKAGVGARRLELSLFRVDGSIERTAIGTGRPSRDNVHLMKLFQEPLSRLDAGFGVELMMLSAAAVEPFDTQQVALALAVGGELMLAQGSDPSVAAARGDETEVIQLVDRLAQRLGTAHVVRLAPRASHLPERAVIALPVARPAVRAGLWAKVAAYKGPRPTRLLAQPEAIQTTAQLPDDPPRQFNWRGTLHRLKRVEGPERLVDEWWQDSVPTEQVEKASSGRDYYRVEDEDGQRFWLYRDGPINTPAVAPASRWYVHGFCA
ncbi:MAG: DNA polymerase Y family protein [Reyranellaceae bacterium]